MDHKYAIENHTAERYLLHELNEDERDAYEEHFFSCSACAEEVQTASDFLESARHVVQDEVKAQLYGHAARRSIWGSWLNFRSMLHPMPAMACALFVFVTGFTIYQNRVTIPELRDIASAQVLTPQPILRQSKGDGVKTLTVTHGKGFVLRFQIPPTNSSSYDVSVLNPSNVGKLSFQISRQDIDETLEIFVPAGKLDAGRYFLLIQDEPGKGEVERIPFDLMYKE